MTGPVGWLVAAVAAVKWAAPVMVAAALLAADNPSGLVAAVATSLTAVTVGWLGYRQHRNDQATEATKIVATQQVARSDATDRLVDQLQEQLNAEVQQRAADRVLIGAQATQLGQLRGQVADLEVGIIRLTAQLVDHDITPVWRPAPLSNLGGATPGVLDVVDGPPRS